MMVNPSGVQMDMLQTVAGGEDQSVDWVWDSAGRLTDTGYAVEMRLPLQSIRFRGGDDVKMGILFWRRVSRIGVSVSWPALEPGRWVFEKHAALIFPDIQPRLPRQVIPSTTYSRSQSRDTPSALGQSRWRGRFRRDHEAGTVADHHAGCDGESGLQPGRERCVPGAR